jgi:hypothetical protein
MYLRIRICTSLRVWVFQGKKWAQWLYPMKAGLHLYNKFFSHKCYCTVYTVHVVYACVFTKGKYVNSPPANNHMRHLL